MTTTARRAPELRAQIDHLQRRIERHAATLAEALADGCPRCASQAQRQIRRMRARLDDADLALHAIVSGADAAESRAG